MGLEKLTFGDICRACAGDTAHSPFRLLLVGHSQGGAVAQIWAWEQLRKGLHPRAMAGYCFASPSVMTAAAVQRAETVPLYHVLNSDDLVPKMGSALRLGIDLTYAADEGLRRACYNWPRDEQHVAHRVIIRPLMGLIRDTSSCMEVGCGLLLSLEGRDPADALPALRALRPDWPLLTRINESASDPMDRLLHVILRRAMSAHESIMGRPLNMERTAEISQLFRKVEDAIGIQAMMTAMVDLAIQPHTVLPREGCACSAYPYITLQGLEALQPAVWLGGEEATRLVINRREEGTPARSREAYHRKHREVRHG